MSNQTKLLAAVFVVALAIRLIALAVLLPELKPDVDLDWYRSLAQSLAAGKGFVGHPSPGLELPNVARTPGYPLFLAGLIRLGGDRLGLLLMAQCFIGAITCGLTVLLAARWLPKRLAAMAGLLVAIDPNSVIRCADLRTETLFTLLLVSGACVLAWRTREVWAWLVAGFIWSAAALVRPIAIFLPMVAIGVLILTPLGWRARFVCLTAFLAAFIPLLGLWAARNAALTGQWFVSTISYRSLLFYRAAAVEAQRIGESMDDVSRRFSEQCGDVEFFSTREDFVRSLTLMRRTYTAVLRGAPIKTLEYAITGCVKLLVGPGTRSLDNSRQSTGAPSSLALWSVVYSLALVVLMALACWGALKEKREYALLICLAAYFVILSSGPESNSRFRTPIMPMLAVLAAASFARRPFGSGSSTRAALVNEV